MTRAERVVLVRRGRSALAANQWVRIDADGTVTITTHKSEMGQSVATSLPMIVADELGADWRRVRTGHATPGRDFPNMRTAGSGSVAGSWRPLRLAAAAAREMLVTAAAARWGVAAGECDAADGQVTHRPTGRRLPFGELVDAAAAVPVPASPTLRAEDGFRIIGRRIPRLGVAEIVAGATRYGTDVRVPGMRFAAIARSPVHGGSLRGFRDERARAVPGVVDVLRVRAGVAVLAENTWAAFRGRAALEVDWDPGPNATLDSAALEARLEAALRAGGKSARREGDVPASLARASRRLTADYRYPFQAHAAIEPLSCVASVGADRCELWAGTQAPNQALTGIAALLGIPEDRITIHVQPCGGAFGRRLDYGYLLEAADVSRAARVPVQVCWSREDDLRHDFYQPAELIRMAAALDPQGRITGWSHRVADFHLTMFGPFDPNADPKADGDPWGGFDTPYAFPALEVELTLVESPVPTGAWRSVTYPASVFARECFLDEIALATGSDPIVLRDRLLTPPAPRSIAGMTIDNRARLRAALALAAERAGWRAPHRWTRNGRRFGRGVAINGYHEGTMVAQIAEVSVGPAGDLRVHRVVCAVDAGLAVDPVGLEQQFEGGVVWALGPILGREVTFAGGRTVPSGFGDYPVLGMSAAPAVEVHLIPARLRPFGIGEQPVPAAIAAVMNAHAAATGRRVRRLPLAPG